MEPYRYCRVSKEKISSFAKTKNCKNLIQKYYGRKVIFVEKPVHFTAAINRSKYLLHFEVWDRAIPAYSFKSLANLIIFNTDIFLKYHCRGWKYIQYCCPNIHPLLLKKALHSCKNPKAESPEFKHLKHLLNLKSLNLHVTNGFSMRKASKVITKFRLLQSFHVNYLAYDHKDNLSLPIKLDACAFFYKISKLPRLQRFSLQTSVKTLEEQSNAIQQDFTDFYLGLHRFKIETEIYGKKSMDIQHLTAKNIVSILKKADSLSLCIGVSKTAKRNPDICQNEKSAELSEQVRFKILKQGERPVKFSVQKAKFYVNIGCLLTRCENLTSLYLKISGREVFWDKDCGPLSNKLQYVVLDFDSFGLKYEVLDDRRPPSRFDIEEKAYEISDGRKVKFHSGLLELLKQLKTRAVGLKTFTLFLCLENFKKSWLKPRSFKELYEKMIEEKAKEFFEELGSFEKCHRIEICKKDGDFDECINRVLSAKSFKTVNVRSCCHNL